MDNRDANNWQANGVYVQASYFLTGESRNYKTSVGSFGRVTPNNSFDPASGHWGAFEVAGRYSWLDLQDEGNNGGEEQNVTLGLNWYLYSNLRLTANYVYADVKDTGDFLGNTSRDIPPSRPALRLNSEDRSLGDDQNASVSEK